MKFTINSLVICTQTGCKETNGKITQTREYCKKDCSFAKSVSAQLKTPVILDSGGLHVVINRQWMVDPTIIPNQERVLPIELNFRPL